MNNSDLMNDDEKTSQVYLIYVEAAMCALIMVFAIFGNLLVIVTILKTKKFRKVFPNILVLNVAFSDVTLVLSSIPTEMTIDALGYFPFGAAGCRLINPLSTYSINVMAMLLIFIAVERFSAIVFSISTRDGIKYKCSILVITHFVAIATVIPYSMGSVLKADEGSIYCGESWNDTWSKVYTVFLFLIQYALPLPVIVVLYAISWRVIQKSNLKTIRVLNKLVRPNENLFKKERRIRRKISFSYYFQRTSGMFSSSNKFEYSDATSLARHKQTMQTLKMFTAVVIVFAVCMMPNQITWFYLSFRPRPLSVIVEKSFYWLTYSNAVLNPWIYACFNPYFKKAYRVTTKKLIATCFSCCNEDLHKLNSTTSKIVRDDFLVTDSMPYSVYVKASVSQLHSPATNRMQHLSTRQSSCSSSCDQFSTPCISRNPRPALHKSSLETLKETSETNC